MVFNISKELETMIGREAAGQGADAWSMDEAGRVYFHAATDGALGFRHDAGRVKCGYIENDGVVFIHGGYDASTTRVAKRVDWIDDKIAVLDDCTKDAHVIGFASTANEAADVFMAYMRERMDTDDFQTLERPTFIRRRETSVASPAFEPIWK